MYRNTTFLATYLLLGAVTTVVTAALPSEDPKARAELETLRDRVGSLEMNRGELQALRREISQLRATQGHTWLSPRRSEEVKSLIREVLSDANARISLLEGGITSDHNGKKFFLSNEDGSALMTVQGHIQMHA